MEKRCCGTRICSPALGVAFGFATGLMMLAFAWVAWRWGYGSSIIDQYSVVYSGYAPTLKGGLYGFLWGLVEGFIFGLVSGWVYNICARCCSCCKSCSNCCNKDQACSK